MWFSLGFKTFADQDWLRFPPELLTSVNKSRVCSSSLMKVQTFLLLVFAQSRAIRGDDKISRTVKEWHLFPRGLNPTHAAACRA